MKPPKRGPWLAQHDVDVIDDHTIAVFNNDVVNTGGKRWVRDSNRITYYDFATGLTSDPHDEALSRAGIRTLNGGLFALLPQGHVMVEETTNGRLAIFDRDNRMVVEYVNRASSGKIFFLSWSRYLDRAEGDGVRDRMQAADCANQAL